MIKNFIVDTIKFDILATKERLKKKIVFCVTKIMFDFWASIQVVFQDFIFLSSLLYFCKIKNMKYPTRSVLTTNSK